jgi:hypothetical protein
MSEHKVDYIFQDAMFCNSSKETHPCTTHEGKKSGKGGKKDRSTKTDYYSFGINNSQHFFDEPTIRVSPVGFIFSYIPIYTCWVIVFYMLTYRGTYIKKN